MQNRARLKMLQRRKFNCSGEERKGGSFVIYYYIIVPSGTSNDLVLCHPLLIGSINHTGPVISCVIVSLCQDLHLSISTAVKPGREGGRARVISYVETKATRQR